MYLYDLPKRYFNDCWCIWRFRIEDLDNENTYHIIRFDGSSGFSLETCDWLDFEDIEDDCESSDDEKPEEL